MARSLADIGRRVSPEAIARQSLSNPRDGDYAKSPEQRMKRVPKPRGTGVLTACCDGFSGRVLGCEGDRCADPAVKDAGPLAAIPPTAL